MQTTAKNRKNSISKEQQKKFFAGATAVAASCVLVHASGFRLPEQSLNGTALHILQEHMVLMQVIIILQI